MITASELKTPSNSRKQKIIPFYIISFYRCLIDHIKNVFLMTALIRGTRKNSANKGLCVFIFIDRLHLRALCTYTARLMFVSLVLKNSTFFIFIIIMTFHFC